MTNYIEEYYDCIEKGYIITSNKVERLYKKLCKDISRSSDPNYDYYYDNDKAERAIFFIESFCRHSKGELGGQRIELELWQKAFISAIFGFLQKKDDKRKYREAALIIGRKNGKSCLSSAILNYLLFADGEGGPEIYSIATKKDQAKIIWNEARSMIKKDKNLIQKARCLAHEIVTDFNDGIFKALASESNSLDGLNSHGIGIDELHAIQDVNLYDVMVDSTSARTQPLTLITSTNGTVRESVFDLKYQEYTNIINSFEEETCIDETVLPVIYELNDRSHWTDESQWIAANPGLGSIKKIDSLRKKVNAAKLDSRKVKNLLTKDFNIPETSTESWLTYSELENKATFDLETLQAGYGIGGFDLSQNSDLTCATVIFKTSIDGDIYVLQKYFLPEDLLQKKIKDDKIPYDFWIEKGYVQTTPGNRIDYTYVSDWFKFVCEDLGIILNWIGYDNYSAEYLVQDLKNTFGSNALISIPQTTKALSATMFSLKADLTAKRINYNNSSILKWCLGNTLIESDKYGRIKPKKDYSTSTKRIDGVAALLNAIVVLEQKTEEYNSLL